MMLQVISVRKLPRYAVQPLTSSYIIARQSKREEVVVEDVERAKMADRYLY